MIRLKIEQEWQFINPSSVKEPGHVGIHWIALAEYSQMSAHVSGFQ